MPQASREIKRRLRSITNTKKITKTMELVSAAKMRRSVEAAAKSNAYADRAWEVVSYLAARVPADQHPLLARRAVKKTAVILISSNRGLCGGYNANVTKTCVDYLQKLSPDAALDIITLGIKGARNLGRQGLEVTADYPKADQTASVTEIIDLAKQLIDGYRERRYDQVVVIYTDFESSLKQTPRVLRLLPILSEPDEELGVSATAPTHQEALNDDYLFEPNTGEVLEFLLPRILETEIYQALLEAEASEHSARMFAMRNATDSAGEMIEELTFAYNQARQSGITQEIAEISAGRAALES